jgi:hypothetical protein
MRIRQILLISLLAATALGFALPILAVEKDEPAVKEDLELSVAPTKDSFARNEPLTFDVVLKNVSKKGTAMNLAGVDKGFKHPWFTYEVIEPATENAWSVTLNHAPLDVSTVSLESGAKVSWQIRLSGTWTPAKKGLPAFPHPGKFQFVYWIGMMRVAPPRVRPVWGGTVHTKPAEFTITTGGGEEVSPRAGEAARKPATTTAKAERRALLAVIQPAKTELAADEGWVIDYVAELPGSVRVGLQVGLNGRGKVISEHEGFTTSAPK